MILMLCCAVVGSAFMLILGVRGPEPGWLRGYGVGGFIGGALGARLVTVMKREMGQPGVTPNGGLATQFEVSGATQGSPSVN